MINKINNLKKETKLIIIAVLAFLILFLSAETIKLYNKKPIIDVPNNKPVAVTEGLEPMDPEKRTLWLTTKELGDDYVGQLTFDNNIVPSAQIVKTNWGFYDSNGEHYYFYSFNGKWVTPDNCYTNGCDGRACDPNDVYLSMNWITKQFDRFGTPFIDYRNKLEDQNIIIYGHHANRKYYGDEIAEKMAFTNLDRIIDKNNYEENKYLEFVLDNEIRRYEVAVIFKMNIFDENDLRVLNTAWDKDYSGNVVPIYFDEMYSYLKNVQYYDTGVELTAGDNTLTLVTCIQGQSDTSREILICKEIERTYYKDREISKEDIDITNLPFKVISFKDSLNFINDKKTGLLFFSFVDCDWCKTSLPVLEEISKEYPNITTHYVNVKREERETNQETYDELYTMFETFLKEELGEDNDKMYLPYFVFVKEGEIVYTHTSTIDDEVNMNNAQLTRFKQLLIDAYELLR